MAQGISIPVVQSGLEASIQQGARNVGTININASVDPSSFKNLAQPLGRVSGLATEFEKSIAASNARVLAFGASVGIINGVQNAFTSLVQTGIEVQKTLADIAAISGRSGAELSKFGDSLFEIGKITGQTFQTASQAALEFSRQGLSVEQTLKRTSDALTLTRFTTLSASEAVDVLTAAANSFSETGITTAQIINKLVAVDTKFAVSAEDLAKGLARAGSIAQEVGVNFDQLNAAVTVAQERTARGGAVIGNALKTIFTRLRSDETVQALRNIGVESLDAQGQLKGAIPLLEELSKKLQGLSGGERIQILEAVASKYNINILSALLNDLGDANSKFGQAVQVSAGAGNQAYERQIELNKTLAAQLNNATVSATQLLNKLAEIGVTQNLNSLLSFVNDLLSGFNKLLDSGSVGGDIAKGLIKGISDVFFTVGLPILAAIFIKLTTDIAKFGVESLKTILGINQQVRERQALEQAVVNTLIRDQEVMASILALSGNRAKQEEYLLGVYNRQLTALQQVQSIASSVTPGLMAGGLSATSGQVKKRGAGGYLPSQEAADVRRGVGGASSSSKVVSIPNFAFGGGKRGTMVANTSEYVVPNFANGGSAVFNQDMARAYGLPAGAKKISAAGGYVPNFNRYVYDSDRIEPDKNSLLKAILASKAKKNLIVGPAGSGKSTYGASLGSFITSPNQLADATEIDVLSGAARTKDGGTSKNFQQIADAVNSSGGKISYLYAGNMDILSRRRGRIGTGPDEGDLRSKKQIAGSMYAPLNQFDFISKVKSSAKNFEMIRGAKGYVPNFADYSYFNLKPQYAGSGLPAEFSSVRSTAKANAEAKIAEYAKANGMDPRSAMSALYTSQKGITKTGSTVNSAGYSGGAAMLLPDQAMAAAVNADSMGLGVKTKDGKDVADFVKFQAYGFSQSSVDNLAKKSGGESGVVGGISKSVADVIYGEGSRIVNLFKPLTKTPINSSAFKEIYDKKGGAGGAAKAVAGSIFEAAMDYALNPKDSPEAQKAIKSAEGKTFDVLNFQEAQLLREAFGATGAKESFADYKISAERARAFADQIILNGAYQKTYQKASSGYVPNFAQGGPLEDAVQREMAAGLDPSQIRITKDGKLKNSQNPNGFAVINTRDEPNGKVPNFANVSTGQLQDMGLNSVDSTSKQRRATRNVGFDFDYGVGPGGGAPANAAPASTGASNSSQQDEVNKSLLTTNKLMLAFGGLTMITAQLQSHIKNADSGLAQFALATTQASQSAAGFASIGSMLGDTDYAKKLSGATGMLGKIAGNLGPIGMAVGAAVGIFGYFQEKAEAAKRAIEEAGKVRVQAAVAGAQKTGAEIDREADNPVQRREMYQREFDAANKEKSNVRSVLENEINSLEKEIREREANVPKRGTRGTSAFLERKKYQEQTEKIREKATSLGNPETLKSRQKAADETSQFFGDQLKSIGAGEVTAARRAGAANTEANNDLIQRIALSTQLNKLSEAFAKQEGKSLITRTQREATFIKDAATLNDYQKQEKTNELEKLAIFDKISDAKQNILQATIKELAKAPLTTVDQEALKALRERIDKGERIVDMEGELNKLKIENNSLAKITQVNAVSELAARTHGVNAEITSLGIKQKSKKEQSEINEINKIALQVINDRLSSEKKLRDATTSGGRAIEDARLQTGKITLQNQISKQPFATREQEAQLARINAQIEKETEIRSINRTATDTQVNSFEALKSSYIEQAKSLTFLTDAQKENLFAGLASAKTAKDLQNNFGKLKGREYSVGSAAGVLQYNAAILNVNDAEKLNIKQLKDANELRDIQIKQLVERNTYELALINLREKSPARAGAVRAITEIQKEVSGFQEAFSYNTTLGFRDGLRDAMSAAISQTDDLGAALQNVAMGFLKTMQDAFLRNAANNITSAIGTKMGIPMPVALAKGGVVSGGSGYRDDVPAMLTGGEFVMRKSAVQKYGASNLERMNSGGMFVPGTRGGGAISGENDLRAFANQSTTSGATDALKGSGSSAFINLEDESQKLSRYALLGDDTINQEVRGAKMQAFDILKNKSDFEKQQKEAEKQQKKALVRQMIGTVAGAALSYGAGKLAGPKGAVNLSKTGYDYGKGVAPAPINPFNVLNGKAGPTALAAYGGLIRRYASGGPTDDIPAMLMSGEYVMNRGASRKYGKQFLDSMNQGRAPRFADGGEAAPSSPTTTTESNAKGMGDVSININVTGQTSQTETQGNSSQGGVDYKKMSEKIKMVVMETLNEEKRLGGSLRTR